MDFYLSSTIKNKVFQVELTVGELAETRFIIKTRDKYFQDFMETEEMEVPIDKQNFEMFVRKYTILCENFTSKLEWNTFVYSKGIFYINREYIEPEDIAYCCEQYANMERQLEFAIHLDHENLLYNHGHFYNLDLLEKNDVFVENKLANRINYKDSVLLFIIDKWIKQKSDNPNEIALTLAEIYGESKAVFLIEVYNEDPFLRWR